jgi:hypothetical protein
MTRLQQFQSTLRRLPTGGSTRATDSATEALGPRAGRPSGSALGTDLATDLATDLGANPVAVQVRIGDRWIAGQALSCRPGASGRLEVLVSHHGHLVWIDQHEIRLS